MESPYEAPKSNLNKLKQKELSASEKLAQSRRDIEESIAVSRLNMVWGFRLVVDVLFSVFGVFVVYDSYTNGNNVDLWSIGTIFIFMGAEIIPIVGYFQRKKWCVLPLNIFAGFSLLNFPIGTILSIIHYLNIGKIQFDRNIGPA